MEIITFSIDVRLWDSHEALEFCNLGYELFGTISVTPQKLEGPLTNRQPKEISVDSVYPSTHVV